MDEFWKFEIQNILVFFEKMKMVTKSKIMFRFLEYFCCLFVAYRREWMSVEFLSRDVVAGLFSVIGRSHESYTTTVVIFIENEMT